MTRRSVDVLLQPRSVAVIGASDDASKAGGRPLHYLINGGFAGPIVPVNPRRDRVQGLAAARSIRDTGVPIDCAVIVVPAEATIDTLEECAEAGVGSAVVFSGGFAELGAVGEERQAAMASLVRRSGMRLLGPNCLGLYSTRSRAFLTMSGLFQAGFPAEGSLGVVSQSGGYAGQLAFLARARGIDIGQWVTTGNEVDVDVAEVLAAYARDETVSTVLAYVEGVKDGPSFVAALAALRAASKPVIAFKVGRSARGSDAVASHTASLSGADKVYDAVFREFGVVRVDSTEEALDIAYAARAARLPRGRRYAAVTTSGGVGGQLADLAEPAGFVMPSPPAEVAAALRSIAPLGSAINPVDVSGQVINDPTIMSRSVATLARSGAYDVIHAFIGFSAGIPWIADAYRRAMTEAAGEARSAVLLATISGDPALIAAYEQAGYLVFEEPARAIKAAAALATFAAAFDRPASEAAHEPAEPAAPVADPEAALHAIGIPRPMRLVAGDPEAAGRAAERIGGRVVVKILSPDIPHKTEVGGVALGLQGSAQVAEAASAMLQTVGARAPDARLDGFEVTALIEGGVECVLGSHVDPVFGPVVTFGLGGIFCEILADTVVRRAPIDRAGAIEMIRSLRSAALFDGPRGLPKADVEAVAEAIVALSRFAAARATTVAALEINPLVARAQGEGVVALDVLMETRIAR